MEIVFREKIDNCTYLKQLLTKKHLNMINNYTVVVLREDEALYLIEKKIRGRNNR